ncbi:MAG: glucosyl-3-phosphoglycerate phosphatase, partial [Nocardioidaceae bacterium]|nr:glucosyl-3-phosphoglycerate phosphatase [Nocardioidaceae bacterium]
MQLLPRSARPTRLVLLRHGRTSWNKIGRAQGHADISLDAVGVRQARTAAKRLARYEPSVIWSSDLARARETAEYVAAA